jgi:hypothetical protein
LDFAGMAICHPILETASFEEFIYYLGTGCSNGTKEKSFSCTDH